MIPAKIRPFFWDVNVQEFSPEAHPEYTIGRILELGDLEAITWLKMHFSEAAIRQVIRDERRLSPKSATFWALLYGIPEKEVASLR